MPICSTSGTGNIDFNLESHRRTVNHDIGLHIDTTLASDTYIEWSQELKKEVRQALVERADGMYVPTSPNYFNPAEWKSAFIVTNEASCLGSNIFHASLMRFETSPVLVPFERL
jgi:hypothetical protein